MLLGHARGKVGDLVFSRSNGQQVVRSRAAVVKNPKTESQMIQRILLNTVAQGYSKLRAIVNHSFEGVQEGQKSMSEFMRRNLDKLRSGVAQAVANGNDYSAIEPVTPVGMNFFSPQAFVVAVGSMPELAPEFISSSTATVDLKGTTYKAIIDGLGLQRGDQLTFLSVRSTGGQNSLFDYVRVILDPTNADGTEADINSLFISGGAINLPSPRNQGEFGTLSIDDNGVISYVLGVQNAAVMASGIIVSRRSTDGTWRRSNASLVINNRNYGLVGYDLDSALQLSEQQSLGALSDLYLNNAGTGRLAATGQTSLETTTANGTPVELVGLTTVAVAGVNFTKALATDGDSYYIRYDNENTKYYGRALADGNAYADTAWVKPGDEFAPEAQSVNVSYPEGPLWDWLASQGVSIKIFVAAPVD